MRKVEFLKLMLSPGSVSLPSGRDISNIPVAAFFFSHSLTSFLVQNISRYLMTKQGRV